MDKFCERFAAVLDLAEVKPTDVLEDLPDWDSLAALTVVVMLGSDFGVHLKASDLRNLSTIQDLQELVGQVCHR
jgi:acyl carrier protein